MINKENNEKKKNEDQPVGPVDIVKIDVQCHLLIVDLDTNEVIVNQRG